MILRTNKKPVRPQLSAAEPAGNQALSLLDGLRQYKTSAVRCGV
jgi:hypothetical protein